jgi:hypothetical protein
VWRTFRSDFCVLMRLDKNLVAMPTEDEVPCRVSVDFVGFVSGVSRLLRDNVEQVRKEVWEDRHGNEVFGGLLKMFTQYESTFKEYYKFLGKHFQSHVLNCQQHEEEQRLVRDHYLDLPSVYLRPIYLVEYFWGVCIRFSKGGNPPGIRRLGDAVTKIRFGNMKNILNAFKIEEFKREFGVVAEENECWGEFVRMGVLLKLCRRKGVQNRIFFLVSIL